MESIPMRIPSWLRPLSARRNPVRNRRWRPRPTFRPRVEGLEDRCQPSVTIHEFPLPSPASLPDTIHAGPDGNLWFQEEAVGRGRVLGQITPTGQIAETSITSLPGNINSFDFGPDGNIWVGTSTDICEVTPQGELLHDYPILSTDTLQYPALGVAVGPDGNIWYTETGSENGRQDVIGRLTPSGQITEFPIPFAAAEIVSGPDGNLWFDATTLHSIGRITPAGDVTTFDILDNGGTGAFRGLTADPNGTLLMSASNVVEVNTAGQLVATVSNLDLPFSPTLGPDGNLWAIVGATATGGDAIASVTPQGIVTEYPVPTPNAGLAWITAGPDGNLWFTEYGANQIGEVVLAPPPSSLSGVVWQDFNDDGQVDFAETAVADVTVTLTGTDDLGNAINQVVQTDANGIYAFTDLRPSNAAGYTIIETQPTGLLNGTDTLGTVNGVSSGNAAVQNVFSGIDLSAPGAVGENYNFGERPATTGLNIGGQAATIGFWQNNKGQALIKALNGGPAATQLGTWLATTFPNMYANLNGETNTQVAAFYKTLFARTARTAPGGPPKVDAQVMATALAVYVTNETLAGTTATAYGFRVTTDGLGAAGLTLGDNGSAFGESGTVSISVLDLLLAVNSHSHNGVLFDVNGDGQIGLLEAICRTIANDVFALINEAGGI